MNVTLFARKIIINILCCKFDLTAKIFKFHNEVVILGVSLGTFSIDATPHHEKDVNGAGNKNHLQ